jgi:hypothetical protein
MKQRKLLFQIRVCLLAILHARDVIQILKSKILSDINNNLNVLI